LRRGTAAPVLLTILLLAGPGRAWERPTELVHGTARVLEKGEMIIGILTPLGYGVHERVTVFTHPILDLLLTPNVWFRFDLWSDDAWAVALDTGYQQSFLSVAAGGGVVYPGYLQAGVAGSFAVHKLQITLATGYEGRFSGRDDLSDVFLYYRVGLDLLADERNLVMMRLVGDVGLNRGSFEIPTVTLLYCREFGRGRLGIGLAAGSFPVKGMPAGFDAWPIYPWFDYWWRF